MNDQYFSDASQEYLDSLDNDARQGYLEGFTGSNPTVKGRLFGMRRTLYFQGFNQGKTDRAKAGC